ncbi:MAG: Arc family DNA-binding protein [Oscillospiraceae bacterium]|nr:Arc family DNA-binding protein [Oscillospiraceae bacterium]
MKDKLLRYTLRIDRHLFAKFRYVAEYNGRSANKEIEQMMKRRVEKFEKEHEEIILGEDDK